ncbi:MAG: hypothetical protein DRQ02_09070 [Candidatus Latescibacterota bacterium]|nr:MAG: hypothetical protein DRQ02_09070 [Candidatus Latescibacterota bacterium]RKY72600.1 MAG: hypothetical protein DRQ24_04660 [Candidatus Latescibacterota bacterium]
MKLSSPPFLVAATWLSLATFSWGCTQSPPPVTYQQIFRKTFNLVTRGETAGGVYVQVTFRTFAFELAGLYSQAEKFGWDRIQLESKIKETIDYFATSEYPPEEELGLRNLYQIYTALFPLFEPNNPLHRKQYENFRKDYVRRILKRIYEGNILRNYYTDKWGYEKYDRLDFSIYLENKGTEPPVIADIGQRTFLEDEAGNRYRPIGLFDPYPHDFDRPRQSTLKDSDRYRVFFVNRKTDGNRIITKQTRFIKLIIENLGKRAERGFRWDLPFEYPEISPKIGKRF